MEEHLKPLLRQFNFWCECGIGFFVEGWGGSPKNPKIILSGLVGGVWGMLLRKILKR